MIVTIASGKGGTGKTMVTASLISVWDSPVTAVDLDVEEPNLHLFLNPEIQATAIASMEVPVVVEENCTSCGACSEMCQFKAISLMGDMILTFPEMCHGCGGCFAVCPAEALVVGSRELGEVISGYALGNRFFMGRLRVGEAMSPPLMDQVKQAIAIDPQSQGNDIIVDGPPGVSCPAIAAVSDSDIIVLVADPTPFGMHDFQLALEAFAPLNIPMGVVINNVGLGDEACHALCRERGLPIWAEIPHDRAIAVAYSRGEIVAEALKEHRPIFEKLCRNLKQAAGEVAHA